MTEINKVKILFDNINNELSKRIIGNKQNIELIMITLLSRGHVLLEGVPGIAKSYLAASISEVLGLSYKRLQFVPDLMPADITGSSIYNPKTQEFKFIEGPVFANILLCDEINRAPPKTQAALLESMQEKQVSVEGTARSLPDPFFVIATQNPIESVGVYQLPEAQLDRFMIKLNMHLPGFDDEFSLLKSKREELIPEIGKISSEAEIIKMQNIIENVKISDVILEYIARLVVRTRFVPQLSLGGSPRASMALMMMSRARAAIYGRDYVEPDDVKQLFYHVMNHRLILTPEAEVQQLPIEQIIENIIVNTEVEI